MAIDVGASGRVAAVAATWSRRSAAYESFYRRFPDDRRAAWLAATRRWLGDRPRRVLDVGTGTGFLAAVLAEVGHDVVGVDPAAGMLPRARAEADRRGVALDLRHGSADRVDELDLGRVDVVTARFVLWTLPDPAAALAAWRRVLAPGGTLLVADGMWRPPGRRPAGPRAAARLLRDRVELGRHLPHWRGLDASTAAALLGAAGFAAPARVDVDLAERGRPIAEEFFVLRATAPTHAFI